MYGFLVVIYVSAAVCMDLRMEKVRNGWIIMGWLLGLYYQVGAEGLKGVLCFTVGSCFPIGVLYLLFAAHMLGAGDIKLLSVIGGMLGLRFVLFCILYSFVCGGILSAAILLSCGNGPERFRFFINYIQNCILSKTLMAYRKPGKRAEHLHFSVAILMSVLLGIGGIY